MNWVDLIVIAVLSLFGLRGFFRGLFREVLSLAGLIAGFMLAVAYDQQVASYIAAYWKVSPLVLKGAAFVTIFFLVYFSLSLVGWLLHRSEKLLFLQTLNRSGGVAVGVGKGVALTALVVFLLSSTAWLPQPAREKLERSYFNAPLSEIAQGLVRIGKEKLFPTDNARQLSSTLPSNL
ncbi:MAG TPA: CvpA family protein [Burkholderiales bacterium]|nr:CvpA family protein [Burkholderiales bacterium]